MINQSTYKRNVMIAEFIKKNKPAFVPMPNAKMFLTLVPQFLTVVKEVVTEVKAEGDEHQIFKILREK